MSEHKVLVPLATGFEEVEAITIIDLLRRAEIPVTTAALDGREVLGAHGGVVQADFTWEELDEAEITAIVLPGGMPGATNLRDDRRVLSMVERLAREGQLTAAICAAPMVLGKAGLLGDGCEYTCYPGMDDFFQGYGPRTEAAVIRSGQILTGRGPGAAMEFGLAVIEALEGSSKAAEVAAGLLVDHSA
jgi:4-methyl-5(b-hydroxyethyl)-thiazole monophosphate biosynthesis